MTRLARMLDTVAARSTTTDAYRIAADILNAHGYPTGSGGGTRGGSVADPTALAALAADDTVVADARRFVQVDAELVGVLARWCAAEAKLRPTVVRDATPAGVGNCQACNRPCVGSSESDRLRAGLCNACHQAWLRYQATMHDGMMPADRQTWMRARRLTHWDDSHIEAVAARHKREPEPVGSTVGTGGAFTWRDPK